MSRNLINQTLLYIECYLIQHKHLRTSKPWIMIKKCHRNYLLLHSRIVMISNATLLSMNLLKTWSMKSPKKVHSNLISWWRKEKVKHDLNIHYHKRWGSENLTIKTNARIYLNNNCKNRVIHYSQHKKEVFLKSHSANSYLFLTKWKIKFLLKLK